MEAVVLSHESGFSFSLLELRDYTRKDGTQTQIKVWRAHCVKCGAAFDVTTPKGVERMEQSNTFAARRCEKHRQVYANQKANMRKARAAKRLKRARSVAIIAT